MAGMKEHRAWTAPGLAAILVDVVVGLAFYESVPHHARLELWGLGILFLLIASGFFVLQPNESGVVTFFGFYLGSVSRAGLQWTFPLTVRRKISRRVRNFTSHQLKVNDAAGNPVEIAAVVVWRVADTAQALFDVDDYASFVGTQAETALRALAGTYPYDAPAGQVSLLGSQTVVAEHLARHLEERLKVAGVEVVETRLAHLAYAPEIAQTMLRRQQAAAIVAARQTIVEGAVGMVQQALDKLVASGIVDLDEERRAAMVNNLMVVLASDQATQPIVNTGTLYG